MKKLTTQQKDTLQLIGRSPKTEGWAKVSKVCMQIVEPMPSTLVELIRKEDGTSQVRLTALGESLLEAMKYL